MNCNVADLYKKDSRATQELQRVNVNGLNTLLKRLRSLDWIQTITFFKDATEKQELCSSRK